MTLFDTKEKPFQNWQTMGRSVASLVPRPGVLALFMLEMISNNKYGTPGMGTRGYQTRDMLRGEWQQQHICTSGY